MSANEGAHLTTDRIQRLRSILEVKRDVVVRIDQICLQVYQANVHGRALDVDTDEVATIRIEPIEQREAPDTDLELTLLLQTPSILKLLDDLGGSRHTHVKDLGDIGHRSCLILQQIIDDTELMQALLRISR